MSDDFLEIEFDPPIEELEKELSALREELRGKALHSATVAGAKPYKDTMKRLVPVRTGRLRSTIGHKKLSKSERAEESVPEGDAAVLVGPNRLVSVGNGKKWSFAWLAHILEVGAKPHVIRGRRGGSLRFSGLVLRQVNHPGIKPDPFISRTLKQVSRAEVEEAFYQGLTKHLARLKSRGG